MRNKNFQNENYVEKDEQVQKNVELKEALIKRANELVNSDQMEQGTEMMEMLMDEWKTAGFAGDQEDELWEQFQEAHKKFYDRKHEQWVQMKNNIYSIDDAQIELPSSNINNQNVDALNQSKIHQLTAAEQMNYEDTNYMTEIKTSEDGCLMDKDINLNMDASSNDGVTHSTDKKSKMEQIENANSVVEAIFAAQGKTKSDMNKVERALTEKSLVGAILTLLGKK